MAEEIFERADATDSRIGWLAAGGMIGALLVSSCCIAPLVFVLLGLSGAWIGNLTGLEPYRPYFTAMTLVFIGLGFWRVYFASHPRCSEGIDCARLRSTKLVKIALWLATALVILALTTSRWAPYFY